MLYSLRSRIALSSSAGVHLGSHPCPALISMLSYTVTISTGSQWFAGTDDYIYITLVGTEGCSERTLLDKALYNDFERGAVSGAKLRQQRREDDCV